MKAKGEEFMIDIKLADDKWIESKGYRKQILADSSKFDSEGALAQVVEIKPGHVVQSHYHKRTYEFYYVLAGDVAFTINGGTRRLREGEMMMTEPNDVHRVENDGEKAFQVLVFKTNAEPHDTYWQENK
jgi:quercetin dioxygenase-like cupin family protein